MKARPQFLAPRQAVIYAATRKMLDETALDATTFAMHVAERYVYSTAPDVRQVKLRLGEGAELIKAMENNGQILRRYMDGTVKTLPADLEDAWVLALPEPYRSDCERDLARRRGRLSFEVMDGLDGAECTALGGVLSQTGELCTEWGKALEDGQLTEAEVKRICDEADDVIAAVLQLRKYVLERRERDAARR
jgi:hypothetical protein